MADAVALAGVFIAGVSVLTSGVVTVKVSTDNAKRTAELARESRIQQRLEEAYVDVLRIVEREGLWTRAEITNLVIFAEDRDWDPLGEYGIDSAQKLDLTRPPHR
jgi:hypothetical protein